MKITPPLPQAFHAPLLAQLAVLICLSLTSLVPWTAHATTTSEQLYISSVMTLNGNGSMDGQNYNSVGTRGIFFTTGPSGPYKINLLKIAFWTTTGSIGDTYTYKIDVRNVSGGLPGASLFATDAITWRSTNIPFTVQNVDLSAAELPNISSLAFQANTSYSIVFYGMSSANVGMLRNSITGAASTVTYQQGFSNAGFFQNGFTYTGSHSISLGVTAPTVTASTSSVALGTTTAGTASTPAQSFTVGGSNLTADLIVTAPTGVELSKDSGSTWQTSETLTPSDGTVSTTTIQARTSAGASTGSISGNITCASSGATTQNVSVTGTVNSPSYVVTNNNDSGAGSLRAAISSANGTSGAIITFDPTFFATPKTITLTSGSMTISSALTIQGPGANALAVNGGGTDRIFFVTGDSSKTISGLTLTNGHAVGSDNNGGGGAIFNVGGGPMSNASLTLDSCAITGSTADTFGGGILNFDKLTVSNSTISGNTANGAAIGGGGIDSVGDLTMKNSTLSGNSAPNATSGGGGLFSGAPAQISNSTITNNQASFVAGGIAVGNFSVTVGNSIIAANQNNATLPDVGGNDSFTSQGHNLIGNKGTVTGFTNEVNGDIVGTSSPPIDPMLSPLQNNGGPTQTHALLTGSRAINAGDNTLATNAGLTTDQRGVGFPRTNGTTVDIGALEALLFTPTLTNAKTDEDVQSSSGLVITANVADGGGTTNYKITNILGGSLFKNDGTTAISAGSFITKAEGLAGLKFTPSANLFGPVTTFSFDVQASVSAADAGLKDAVVTATITVNPVADVPTVTNSSATTSTQTTSGLVISRNAVDSTEIAFFKITNIQHGTLFKNNGTTVISAGDFITFAEGNAGLKFTPANGFSGQATFDVAGSVDNAGAGLGPVATATINMGTANPTAVQIGVTGALNRQNGLYELTANVTNSTALDINGFRLHVDYSSYVTAFPSLKLQNATSYASYPDVYVDYPYPVKVGATVPVRLSFYTSNRAFPNPFSPVLSVATLSTSQTAQPNAPGVQVDRVLALNPGPIQTMLLEFPSLAGHWYRISYSSNDMSHWFYAAIPVQATGSRTQWIDTGAPLTDSPPSSVTSRFYKVSEIVTP